MFKNYIKTAWRNIRTNVLFSTLNIGGLAIGIAICIPLFLFVMNELSFDDMYKNKKDIYRVNLKTNAGAYTQSSEVWANVPNALAPAIGKNIPEVKYVARMIKNEPASLGVNKNNFTETGLYWCDADIFKIFDIPFIEGSPSTALAKPNTIVISKEEANRLFGKENAIGKIISIDNLHNMEVTGVYETLPGNSTIDCNMIGNFLSSGFNKRIAWDNASFETFCLLDANANTELVDQRLNDILKSAVDKDDQWYSLQVQPLSKIHLFSAGILSDSARTGDIKEIKNFTLLALLILLIACINYMNLSTARSGKRAKEVGINKTLGASRGQMIKRFYIETALVAFIAILLGYFLSFFSVSLFNFISGKDLPASGLFSPVMLLCIFCLWVFTSLIAGSYPALCLSVFSPLTLMQKKISGSLFDVVFRKGLVVLQFTSSVVLIIAVMVIAQQMKFIGQKKLGFTPEGVAEIRINGVQNSEQLDALKNNLRSINGVVNISAIQAPPGEGTSGRTIFRDMGSSKGMDILTCNADNETLNVLDMKLLAGTQLPAVLSSTDTVIYTILNKQAVNYLGYTPEQAVGKIINIGGLSNKGNVVVSGVVADFNYASLRKPIGPYLYYRMNGAPEPKSILLVRFNTGAIKQTLSQMEAAFKKAVPDAAFDYRFLDSAIAALYASERVTTKVSILFSILAIFVSCLGLFGLAAFTAEQRTKEIGIRKVLGAGVLGITSLLNKDFARLIVLSIAIAVPVAMWMMNSWLNGFAYRIGISVWVLIAAALVSMFIALITVSFQAIKAATANPVKSLRTE